MAVHTNRVSVSSQGHADTLDITRHVHDAVQQSGLTAGIVTVFVVGSTAALTTIEFEDGALDDFRRLFDEIAAEGREYKHNLRWHDGNGHSHVRAALLGPSLTVPFSDRKLMLGTWQQIMLIDFDNRPRQREIICQVMGE